MINDERIRQTRNHIASRAFGIWYVLLLATLLYRQFYMGQALNEYWDIALIFFIGTSYVAIAGYARGAVHENSLARFWKRIVPGVVITIVALSYLEGRVDTVAEFLGTLIFALIGVAFVGLVFYFFYRRWEEKINLED